MSNFEIYIAFWIFIIGLCIGSFLNVVILRGLSGESIVFPASKCPKCSNNLKWWMNIPVFSYLFLKGKCHYCKSDISIQYPIIELITGLLFLFIFLKFSFSLSTLFFIIGAALLIVMSVCDIKESVIIDFHSYIFIFAGFLFHILSHTGGSFLSSLLYPLYGALAGFLLYEIIARSGYLFAGQRAFGEGDSLIAAGIGAFFGWKFALLSFFISVLLMSVFTFPYFLIFAYKKGKKKTVHALIASLIAIIASYLVSRFDLLESFNLALIFLFLILAVVIWSVKQILTDVKNKNEQNEENFCILPFGPSMAVSFLVIMFWSNELKSLILSYFS